MLARDIDSAEADTIEWNRNRGALVLGGVLDNTHYQYRPVDRTDYYFGSSHLKKRIVLHFTIGYLGGDLSHLTRSGIHVSVPYVIARNGTIFELHDPSLWSYHLGPNAIGGNKKGSQESIGIELSNIGPLELSGNWLWNYYGDRFCHVDEVGYYIKLDTPFRGYSYYATFTEKQYRSLWTIAKYLKC